MSTPTTRPAMTYYCAMHPRQQYSEPGKCPICAMDLIPLLEDHDPGPRALQMSEAAKQLADIETVEVERKLVEVQVSMVGKIEFDESKVKTITAWVAGRLERLYVDYTGIPINKGDHLVEIYSPDLLSAQQELIEAKKSVERLRQSHSEVVRASTQGTLEATREKLRLWGLSSEQIREIEIRGHASDHVLINAPIGGIVISKLAKQGDFVSTGTPIFRIAELSRLWLMLDAYESDLTWLRYGQQLEFTTQAFPGEVFNGRIDFIDWVVNPHTRTVKLRVNVENLDGRLKPGMFARATVHSTASGGGRVLDPSLEGKWICSMHPGVVKDKPGECTICDMPLVLATELLGSGTEKPAPVLVIPASAPLITGKRAVVYVELPDRSEPTFELREIVLGPKAGEHYVVLDGLQEGEKVVVRGNFKIDSAMQIQAKPSMMNPEGGKSVSGHQHGPAHGGEQGSRTPRPQQSGEFLAVLSRAREAYFRISQALAADGPSRAQEAFASLGKICGDVPLESLEPEARSAWEKLSGASNKGATTVGIEELRISFRDVSEALLVLERSFGHTHGGAIYEVFCPMAFDRKGASWLQTHKEVTNPYFGSAMLRCGEIRQEFPALSARTRRGGSRD
ncbi:MAG: efflux RND transporter periplasmic adaptor subunit [Planctomycetota bacterium]